jgi:hypothetical protein
MKLMIAGLVAGLILAGPALADPWKYESRSHWAQQQDRHWQQQRERDARHWQREQANRYYYAPAPRIDHYRPYYGPSTGGYISTPGIYFYWSN